MHLPLGDTAIFHTNTLITNSRILFEKNSRDPENSRVQYFQNNCFQIIIFFDMTISATEVLHWANFEELFGTRPNLLRLIFSF